MSGFNIQTLLLFLIFLLFSGTLHELAHALAADYFGDPTPGMNGRLTLNPIPHIDPIWTLVMPAVLLIMSGGQFAFGGAKPVSMNPANFRDPERDFTIAALVGPLSNFILAAIAIFIGRVFVYFDYLPMIIVRAVFIFYFTNIILGLFNMIPVPPLDGSRLLRFFLPPDLKRQYDRFSGMPGMFLILALAMLGVFNMILGPFIIYSIRFFEFSSRIYINIDKVF